VTFNIGSTRTQIDYFLIGANSRRLCKDCKVIPSECPRRNIGYWFWMWRLEVQQDEREGSGFLKLSGEI